MNFKKNASTFTSTGATATGTSGVTFGSAGFSNNQLNQLLQTINEQQKIIKHLKELLKEKNAEVDKDLTEDDIKFMLMKCHPDKNMNSKQAAKVTAKLLKLKESI
tara:strand:+ start:472 stop:786 length:315 start_codon:yes stop_codon:yes gene_type:complete